MGVQLFSTTVQICSSKIFARQNLACGILLQKKGLLMDFVVFFIKKQKQKRSSDGFCGVLQKKKKGKKGFHFG